MVNAGRILILAKGSWSSTTNYMQLDLVSYNSIAYLARQASVGVNPAQDTQMNYWMPFGSAASIATTSTPGLVMPDGQTITITNTGLIKAVLGLNDVSDVTITSPANGQVLKYNSSTQKWENGSLGTAAAKNSTNAVTSGSTDLVESGAVYTQTSKAYKNDDATATAIDDADYIPFYDTSAGTKKKIAVSNLNLGNKIVSNSSDKYSSSKAYSVGELCIYNNTLYRCITACSAAAWSVNHSCFVADTLTNALNSANTKSKWKDITNLCQWNSGLTYIRKAAYLRDGEVMFDVSISPIGFINGATIVNFPASVKFLYTYITTGICLDGAGNPQNESFCLAGNLNASYITAFKGTNNYYIALTGIIATEQNS